MNRTFCLMLIVVFGLFLLACSKVEPLELQAGETAVTTPSSPTVPPPTITATQPATQIATATNLPTNPPTPQYTAVPTSRPSRTPSPTPTPPAPDHLQSLTTGQTLPMNHDLLFISEGELRLWQPQTAQVLRLLPNPTNLSTKGWRMTPDQQTILLAQAHVDSSPGFMLYLFDTNSRELRELWSETDTYLFAYALATDGRSAAIITSTTSHDEEGGQETIKVIDSELRQAATLTTCPNRRQKSYENREIDYTLRCTELAAVPHSDTWLWRDIEGVWQGGLNSAPRLLAAHDFFEDSDPALIYSPTHDWSPNGRYQLLSARRFEGGNHWLLDIDTGQATVIENSNFGINPGVIWQWTQDNRLLAVPPPNGGVDILLELWRIEDGQLVQDVSLTLPNPNAVQIATPSQLPDGRFALIINGAGPNLGTITLIPNFNTPPQLLTTLMPLEHWGYGYDQSLTWTPDTAGAVYLYPDSQGRRPFYLPADGTILYELTELLGNQITELVWLP